MTYKAFLLALGDTPRNWRMETPVPALRDGAGRCPIEAVAGVRPDVGNPTARVNQAARALKLSRTVRSRIVAGADDAGCAEPCRRDLLRACGLPLENE